MNGIGNAVVLVASDVERAWVGAEGGMVSTVTRLGRFGWGCGVLAVCSCGGGGSATDDGFGQSTTEREDTSEVASTDEEGTSTGTQSTTGKTQATDGTGGTQGEATGTTGTEMGDIRGVLTLTHYLADAATAVERVGMAGAWRTAEAGVDDVDDFYAVFALQTAFPPAPAVPDTLEHNDVPAGFAWGQQQSWIRAGNAMKLTGTGPAALACLLDVGMVGDLFPVYAATDSSLQPEGCVPQLESWQPNTSYELVLYGGDAFADHILPAAASTPPSLVVTAPDFSSYNPAIMAGQALTVEWEGQDRGRIVMHVWDAFGRMFTVHAADDGAFAISADDLAVLNAGPITMTVARELIQHIGFGDGDLKVVTREEIWGYFDLVAP